MGRQSLNIVGDTAWLFVVVLRDLLRARRWALVNDCFTAWFARPAVPSGAYASWRLPAPGDYAPFAGHELGASLPHDVLRGCAAESL